MTAERAEPSSCRAVANARRPFEALRSMGGVGRCEIAGTEGAREATRACLASWRPTALVSGCMKREIEHAAARE